MAPRDASTARFGITRVAAAYAGPSIAGRATRSTGRGSFLTRWVSLSSARARTAASAASRLRAGHSGWPSLAAGTRFTLGASGTHREVCALAAALSCEGRRDLGIFGHHVLVLIGAEAERPTGRSDNLAQGTEEAGN